jgi:hypothetical protein
MTLAFEELNMRDVPALAVAGDDAWKIDLPL